LQTLEIFQSLWAMELRHPHRAERPPEENFSMVADAGYAGICLDPAIGEVDDTAKLKPLFRRHGLKCMLNVFPAKLEELRPLLELAQEMNACVVNIIGGVMPVAVADAVPVARRWLRDAGDFEMPVLFETHRDGLLNDLFYTLQLIDAVPEMRLCADLSHFVVDRELRLPLRPADRSYFERILDRSDCFQGRIASREQIQIQIDFPQHQMWVELFKGWWKDGMRRWRLRNDEDATLRFLCELGPPGYAITDANGLELSDRWQEAATIRAWAGTLWQELQSEEKLARPDHGV
jgi:hypothetical protein